MSKNDGSKIRPVALPSLPVIPAAAAVVIPAAAPAPVIAAVVISEESARRPDGKLAYETWVKRVGHADVAMPWEKLGANIQAIWTAVAEACDRQTMTFLASERKRLEAFRSSRGAAVRQKP